MCALVTGVQTCALPISAARGLAVYGDDVGLALAQGLDPFGEAGLEEFGVERIDHVVERVMRWKTPIVGQEAAQKVEPLPAPQPDLDEILHPAERRAQHHEQDFEQRIDHAPLLARIRTEE